MWNFIPCHVLSQNWWVRFLACSSTIENIPIHRAWSMLSEKYLSTVSISNGKTFLIETKLFFFKGMFNDNPDSVSQLFGREGVPTAIRIVFCVIKYPSVLKNMPLFVMPGSC